MSVRLDSPPFAAAILSVVSLLLGAPASAQDICVTSRMSLDRLDEDPNGDCRLPAISADGHFIVFESDANDLVYGDTNGFSDIFVVHVFGGDIEMISWSNTGGATDGDSDHASISGDGRYVVFESVASNLVGGDGNGVRDVFRYDRELDVMKRVSVANTGADGNGSSGQGGLYKGSAVSGDGQRVVFQSFASNLVGGDTNMATDIFVYDAVTDSVSIASLSVIGPGAVPANGTSQDPDISADGAYVAFASYANNLVSSDTNGENDIFVVDLSNLAAVRATVAMIGTQVDGSSWKPRLSADGNEVAYESHATTLVPNDTNAVIDTFLFDRTAYTVERVSLTWDNQEANNYCYHASISADGTRVSFTSAASNLVPSGSGVQNVYVRDRWGSDTERWGEDSAGGTGFAGSNDSSLTADGFKMAFMSLSPLVPADTNNMKDVYLRYCGPTATPFCPGVGNLCPCGNGGTGGAGCENSAGQGGGLLTATGLPSVYLDSVTLHVSGLPPQAPILFFQAINELNYGSGIAFGDGLRCAGGALLRLRVKIASGSGTAAYGYGIGSDVPISIRGLVPAIGGTFRYQGWYRDIVPGFCTIDEFNLTNGLRIDWAP